MKLDLPKASLPVISLLLLTAATVATAPGSPDPVRMGEGRHSYEWEADWGVLPEGLSLGNTHGCMAVDSKGRVFLNTDSENAVVIIGADGRFEKGWGKEWAGGLHGMTLVEENGQEFLYLTHTGRHEVAKTTLDGEVLWTIGWPEESGLYGGAGEYRPTGVAVAPDGRFFVADGYGKSYVHRYDAAGKYLGSFGGGGTEPGKMRTPHGIWIDMRGAEPSVLVADRENGRLQSFSLEGELLGVHTGQLRRPCNVDGHAGDLVVADLAGRVTILDAQNELVCHLGDNPDPGQRAQNGIQPDLWKPGVFISPHSACFDAEGNVYVMDWLRWGRVSKLRRVAR